MIILFTMTSLFAAESIRYKLSMPEPHTHYFEVEVVLGGFKQDYVDLKMPVWAPGSYLVREFSKNVDAFDAVSAEGKSLRVEKIAKNTWRIHKTKGEDVVARYNVYAYEMSVRTSFLDADHGYLNGTSVFMYPEGYKGLGSELEVIPFKEWKLVSTALPRIPREGWFFKAKDYDQLADCPIEIGNHKEIVFNAAGIEHRIAMYGEGNYNEETLKQDLTRIIEGLVQMFGENPNDDYLFIVHNLEKGSGGLEHINSTTLQVNRWTYYPSGKYHSFLTLAAHEYIHLWLVKRLRPAELGPFDYDNENYTRLLWVMEGVTSYLSQLIMCQLGYMTQGQYLDKVSESFTNMENTPGNRVQPVSLSSFDAWIKAYRPNENSVNSQVSYYLKGSVVSTLLDVLIIGNSNGRHNLTSVLRYLYEEYYKKEDRGITDSEMKSALEKFAGVSLDEFYEKYIDGTEEIDYDRYLGLAGLQVSRDAFMKEDKKKLGASLSESGGSAVVKSVQAGTPAWKYGLNADDEIIAIDGYRVNRGGINTVLENREIGDELELLVARDGMMKTLKLKLEETEGYYYRISMKRSTTKAEEEVLLKWLTKRYFE